jgi:hypothetical protein
MSNNQETVEAKNENEVTPKTLHWYRVKIQIKKEGFKAVQAASMVLCQSAAAAMSVAEKSAHDVLNSQGYTFKIVGVIKEKFLFVVTEKD